MPGRIPGSPALMSNLGRCDAHSFQQNVHCKNANFVFRSRQRRSCDEPCTMSNFIRLIKKIEDNNPSISTERVSIYIRGLAYHGLTWWATCRTHSTELKTGLSITDIELLKAMHQHNAKSTTCIETGVLLAKDRTVVVGDVIATVLICLIYPSILEVIKDTGKRHRLSLQLVGFVSGSASL